MERYPSISIIIPIKNRKNMVPRIVKSLLDVDYPKVEIIIVDDASNDGTPEMISNYPVNLIKLSHSIGSAKARNIGIQNAQYQIIALTDSDCIVSRNWLRELSPFLNKYDIIGGFVQFRDYAEHRLTPQSQITTNTEIQLNSDINFINTSNMLFKKSIWQSLAGFRNYKLEDVDFSWRALKKGLRVCYIPKGIVFHDNPIHFIHKFNRLKNYGKCYAELMQIHRIKLRYQRPTSKFYINSLYPLILLCSLFAIPYIYLILYSFLPILMIIGIICITPFLIRKFFDYRRFYGWKFIFMLNLMKFFVVLYSLLNFQRKTQEL